MTPALFAKGFFVCPDLTPALFCEGFFVCRGNRSWPGPNIGQRSEFLVNAVLYHHRGGTNNNVLYADGHVTSVKIATLASSVWSTEGSYFWSKWDEFVPKGNRTSP
ncbi:MAG: hypothetical protein IJJ26_00050 [Victivallales bacterium]|nr:hypothetical protein [Victivallales bacterium]